MPGSGRSEPVVCTFRTGTAPPPGDGLASGDRDDQSIPSPTLTPSQLAAVERIAKQEDGVWARAFFDGTAEAFTAHRGGLRHFTIDREGSERVAGEVAPTRVFRRAQWAACTFFAGAAAGIGYLVLRKVEGQPVDRWWLVPVGCFLVGFLVGAAFFGVHVRLPAPSPQAGEWVGLPGPSDGDLSGHTMPGLVKAHPIFCGFWLLFCGGFGAIIFAQEVLPANSFGAPLGAFVGASGWWAIMLCFSRGWVKEGD
jgi:hypothetical protein